MSFQLGNTETQQATRLPLEEIWGGGDSKTGDQIVLYTPTGQVRQFFQAAVRNVIASPLSSVVTLATIALSLFLVGLLLIIFVNVESAASSARSTLAVRIYFEDSASENYMREIASELSKQGEVEDVTIISKKDALAEFKDSLGDEASLLEGLDEINPLPASVDVKIKPEFSSTSVFENIKSKFSKRPDIEKVDYNRGVVSRLNQAIDSFKTVSFILILLVLAVIAFVVSNTIILSVYARKDEIEIMRLVGGSSSYVRAPYLIEGLIFGFLGSLLGLFLILVVYLWSAAFLSELSILQAASVDLQFLPFLQILLLVIMGLLVGLFGSFVAVRRFDEF
ncbi:MAG: permease-like cell division protein FtsX [Bdellovibrionota bacterium]